MRNLLKKHKLKVIFLIITCILIVAVNIFFLWLNGIILPNYGVYDKYSDIGIDVSVYQGEIDWKILSKNKISFAFIKATEGSSFVDPNFSENWVNARDTTLKIGAYHFFSYDSGGKTQAENFISQVGSLEGCLFPVVDIELYGKYKTSPKNYDVVYAEIVQILDALEGYYGVKPIIYTTQKTYGLYLSDGFDEYPMWIRNVFMKPNVDNWTFWQFSDKGKLNGYNGAEKFIDLNAFNNEKGTLYDYMIKGETYE